MASGHYQLQANFTFPLTTEEYMAFLEHAKGCADIRIDLSKATFKVGGFTACLQWLCLMQMASNGGVTHLIFSFKSLIENQKSAGRLASMTKHFAQSDIFFNFVNVTLVDDPKFLETLPKEYRKVYDSLLAMLASKNRKMINYADFVTESKQLFQEFRAKMG